MADKDEVELVNGPLDGKTRKFDADQVKLLVREDRDLAEGESKEDLKVVGSYDRDPGDSKATWRSHAA